MARTWKRMVIHHTATGPHEDVATINAMHEKRGFKIKDLKTGNIVHIGYHYLIERGSDGRGYLKAARPDHLDGAHCPGMNTKAIGLSVVGYFHPGTKWSETMREPLLGDLIGAVAHLCKKYGIPVENITYHQDHKATACPGANFIPRYKLRELVSKRLDG